MKRAFRVAVIAILALAVVANAGLLAGLIVTREPAPKALTAERIETASRPAIVLIQSNYTVHITIPTPTIAQAAIDSLTKQLVAMVRSGQLDPYDRNAVDGAAINLVLANPDAYFSPGTPYTETFDQVATGSGFFVTHDGYLVTAAHVVSADKSEIRAEAVAETQDPKFIANLRTQIVNHNTGLPFSDAQINSMVGFIQRWISKYISVDQIDVRYYLGTGKVQAGDSLAANGARASVVWIDPTNGGHDIAIMKAEVTGVPTLQLASGQPQLGEATYAIGYPRQGYLAESVPLNQTVPATMTTGKVLQVAQQPRGWTAWGTTAQFTHGDSGGPVIDDNGKVIGIVSYSTVDAQGKQTLGGGFFVPSEYVSANLLSERINTASSPKDLTPTYYHALAEGDIQRYKTELLLLEGIKSQSPFDAYVGDDISSTQSQILAGNDKTPPDLASYVPAAAESSGGLIALVLLFWIGIAIAGRRRRPAVVPAEADVAPKAQAVSVEAAVETAPDPPGAQVPTPPLQPATDVVSSPVEVLRMSEPIVETRPPATEEKPESSSDAPVS